VNNGLDSDNDFQAPQEGVLMPKNQPALTNAQIDLIQSWIVNNRFSRR
jgi:hypothetical protein